jgi:hypothetical protein
MDNNNKNGAIKLVRPKCFPFNQNRGEVLFQDQFLSNIEPHLNIQPYLTNFKRTWPTRITVNFLMPKI